MASTRTLRHGPDGMAEAAACLRAGGLVAFPTETVFGLGADATNATAVARIFEAKGRPRFNPLIVHVPDLDDAARVARLDPLATELAKAFWPGPLTLVLPLRDGHGLCALVTAGLPDVAIRVPASDQARDLLRQVGRPVAAPSANPSGRISATRAAHVLDTLDGKIDAVLEGAPCAVGVESTILRTAPLTILREGGLPGEDIARVARQVPARDTTPGRVAAPGQLASHYAPGAAVALDVDGPRADGIYLGFGPGAADLSLSPGGDLVEAAARLFDLLHRADALARDRGLARIDVAPIPEEGLGRAILDRLRRAAAPRAP